ncbi:hypothetical protein O5626_29850, partial [Escherichia coli]|nr:hypothetical protein [Escherichia coli]
AGLPPAIAHTIEQARQGDLHFLLLLLVAVLVFAVTFFVVFVERGQGRIVVNYAKRQQGRRGTENSGCCGIRRCGYRLRTCM